MIWLVGSPCSIGVVPFLLDQVPIVGWLNQLDPHIGCPFFIILVDQVPIFVPQQRELMGSSAQNSSGVHWCRHRVRFNRVPEKVPEKVWEGVPKKVAEKIPGGFVVQSQVRFNRVPKTVPQKVWKALQSQGRFQRRSRSFGVEPGQV